MAFYDKFPYTNFQEINLDLIIKKMVKLQNDLSEFITINTLKYHDPILWDITTQYEANTIVMDASGNAYISSKPVPAGIDILNTEYWEQIGNFEELFEVIKKSITEYTAPMLGTPSAYTMVPGDLIWIADDLYRVTRNIYPGYILEAGTNIEATDVNTILHSFEDYLENFTVENDRAGAAIADIGHYATEGRQQGGFTHDNKFYSYQAGSDDVTGYFKVIDLQNGTSININGVAFGHGNDFAVIGDYVYCAPYTYGTLYSTAILRAPLNDLTAVENFYSFTDQGSTSRVYGVTNKDGKLLCALRDNDYGVTDTIFRLIDINTRAVTDINVDWGNFKFKTTEFPHPIDFYKNRLYMIVSTGGYGESVAIFHENQNDLVLESKICLPVRTPCGMSINEIEAIGRSSIFGENYLLFITMSYNGNHMAAFDCYGRAPETLLTPLNIDSMGAGTVYVNEASASVFEDGTTTYPVKSLQRAQYYSELCPEKALVINTVGDITEQINISANQIFLNLGGNTPRIATTGGCRSLMVASTDSTRRNLGEVIIRNNTEVNIDGNEITGGVWLYNGTLKTNNTKFSSNVNIYAPGGMVFISKSADSPAFTVNATGNSIVKVNTATGITFNTSEGATVLTPGTK